MKKVLYAEVNTKNYKGNFKVVEFLGKIVALEINGQTTDFIISEIVRFTDKECNNINFRPND